MNIKKIEKEMKKKIKPDHPFLPDDEKAFPVDALPPVMRDITEALQYAYKASIDLTSSLSLGVVSACLGRGVSLRTDHPDPTFGQVYLLVATLPGGNKTSLLKFLTKQILTVQKELRSEQRIHTENMLKENMKDKGRLPTKKEINAEIGKSIHTLVVEHSTQEGLAQTLSYNDECLAIISSDCSGVIDDLKGSKSKGNFQGELLLKGYSGEPFDTNLKVADDEHLEDVRLSVTWAGTEGTLRDFLYDPRVRTRGLLSRFLFAYIDDPIPLRDIEPRVVNEKAAGAWNRLIVNLLRTYRRSSETKEVKMSKEALRRLVDFDNARIIAQDVLTHCACLPQRWAENTGRVALILHCAKHLNRADTHELSLDTMEDAIRIMMWFIGREIYLLEKPQKGDESKFEELKATVYNHLSENGPTTARDLDRDAGLAVEERYMLHQWVSTGELVTWNANPGGRPSPTFAMVEDPRIPEQHRGGQGA